MQLGIHLWNAYVANPPQLILKRNEMLGTAKNVLKHHFLVLALYLHWLNKESLFILSGYSFLLKWSLKKLPTLCCLLSCNILEKELIFGPVLRKPNPLHSYGLSQMVIF